MTIKFVCSCGKRLKARDEMASRRTPCPRCGALVGVPALRPSDPNGEAPPDPPRPGVSTTTVDVKAIETAVVELLSRKTEPRRKRRARHLEQYWYECLRYPLLAWPVYVILAMLMTLLSAGVTLLAPWMIADPPANLLPRLGLYVLWGVMLLLVVGVPCSFLDRVLKTAVAGRVDHLQWSGDDVVYVFVSGARWLVCFLNGPVVFAGAALWYWLDCGDAGMIDWLIVGWSAAVGIAFQLGVVLVCADRGWLSALNPLAVADLLHRLGRRSLTALAAASLILLAHAGVLIAGVIQIHESALAGCAILTLGWASGVFWCSFFCRMLGVWCYRTRLVEVKQWEPDAQVRELR